MKPEDTKTKKWGDKNYKSLNFFLREKFGEKVFKISLDVGFSCPNRDGTISSGGCIFCSERGSGDFAGDKNFSITKQFEDIKKVMNKKWKSGKYIAYFQAYTNTYAPVEKLKQYFEEALSQEGAAALAIATRPDCLSEDVLELLENINSRTYLWVELGLQTSDEKTAKLINRGYDLSTFEEALTKLRRRNIDVVVHAIFGLPGEDKDTMLETIRYLSCKDIQGIKLHLLHVMKNTPIAELYEKGGFRLLEQEEYIDLICRAITMLPASIVIHRLTGDAPRNLLIGPEWSLKKWEILNAIDNKLNDEGLYQGLYVSTK